MTRVAVRRRRRLDDARGTVTSWSFWGRLIFGRNGRARHKRDNTRTRPRVGALKRIQNVHCTRIHSITSRLVSAHLASGMGSTTTPSSGLNALVPS